MSVFAAKLTTVDGFRSVELSCGLNSYDREQRLIKLIVRKKLKGFSRLPLAYQFLEETKERPYPLIIVLAGPGVSVVLERFPDTYIGAPGFPIVDIHRLQDPELIPPMAADLRSFDFGGSYETGEPFLGGFGYYQPGGAGTPVILVPDNAFKIDRLPNGVVIKHIGSQQEFILEVPSLSSSKTPHRDADARFAFEIDPEGKPGSSERPLLKIVKTPAVSILTADNFFNQSLLGRRDAAVQLFVGSVFEVDDINDIPPQGASIIPQRHWREIRTFKRVKPVTETLFQAGFDVSLSLIPIVGDIADIAEFFYGIYTGHDKWGQELSATDLTIMGVAALLPLVGSGVLKAGKRLAKEFGNKSDVAAEVLAAINKANLSSTEADVVREMSRLLQAGRRPTEAMLEVYSGILKRISGDFPVLDDLINAGGTGFTHVDLEEAYSAYKQGKGARGEPVLGPRDWALRQSTGAPRRILETILGMDYVKRARGAVGGRPVNLIDIPRPAGYSDELLTRHFEEVLKQAEKATERLEKFFAAERSSDPVLSFLARRKVKGGHFRILKGNVAEILSMKIQREIFTSIARKYPGAKLISGVRLRAMEAGKLSPVRLFTDNVIAVERQGKLEILAVFEVKSGYRGGQEATEQVFEWVERIIEDGSQFVLPKGAVISSADGTTAILKKERLFTYKPTDRTAPEVTSLLRAQRFVITAKGVSHLGMDSAMRTAPDITRLELEVTAEQLDFLCGEVFKRVGG